MEANRPPEIIKVTAKCEMCDWQITRQPMLPNLTAVSDSLEVLAREHEAATGHSVRMTQGGYFSANTV